MKVLLLGAGGREHALAWKLSQSPLLEALYCAPGNPGTAELGTNCPVDPADPPAVVTLARTEKIDLVVVGPEVPLVRGVADALRAAGIAVYGPSAAAARLEGSKAFAKEVMRDSKVPTASAEVFETADDAEAFARGCSGGVVVKRDGLAAGKGVVVANDAEQAVAAVRALAPLSAGSWVLEERLEGEEISLMALCDGTRWALLPTSRDHKRVGDGDVGPNTGGMGAFAPAWSIPDDELQRVGERVIAPVLSEMGRRGAPFVGTFYAGLMLTRDGPKVLEINCRFGDPETQVLMLQLDEDLLPLLDACARGRLEARASRLGAGASCGVVLAAEGYPGVVKKGDAIEGIDAARACPGAQVFFSGVRKAEAGWVTDGGRVMTVCARGDGLADARAKAYAAAKEIRFRGMHLRSDIAAREVRAAP